MHPSLHDEILKRVLADETLPAAAQDLVDAACRGPQALARQLASPQGDTREPAAHDPPQAATQRPIYLERLVVQGFRGIGPEATLRLHPAPGLTLVVGRNGCGKSSFAEALEALLTGTSSRWRDRHVAWRQGWRNLHEGNTRITARFTGAGERAFERVRSWGDQGELDACTVTTTAAPDPLAEVTADIAAFRPFLSYADLGTLLSGEPSRLFDELSSILGLEDVTVAIKALTAEKKRFDAEAKQHRAEKETLVAALAAVAHPEAESCRAALDRKKVDLEQIEAIARGESAQVETDVAMLRQLAELQPPDFEEVTTAAIALRDAMSHRDALASASAAHAGELAEILEHVLAYHRQHGGDCPACGAPVSEGWAEARGESLARLRAQSEELDAAATRATQLSQRARSLVRAAPAVMHEAARLELAGFEDALRAWGRWSPPPAPAELADHLERHVLEMVEHVVTLRDAARSRLELLEADWRPAANRVVGWVQRARDLAACADVRKALDEAATWLKDTEQQIRDARFAPIADHTQRIWAQLRQRSNVDIASVSLAGTQTRRHVDVDVTVDGTSGVAVGVMSQGELNALALSLFLPRMALPDSPFGFVVIDDPVQAMDPHKVDGLARVLEEFAGKRQVLVFTHDTRLPEAIRRLQIDAEILEVTRGPNSVLEIRPVYDPARRALDDARALLRAADRVDEGVLLRLVPSLGRTAIEAACVAAIRRRAGGAVSSSGGDLEAAITEAKTTHRLAALAFFGEPDRESDVFGHLNRRVGSRAGDAFRACKEGAHGGWVGDAGGLVAEVARIVTLLESVQ
ncbi:MAG: AAA family ATPase [Deltaproteobacteria bacterium]|nr:AAA family ATPase [Deltaproteobacteria bacterium]MBK8717458.1 AAA family ATPase [Deltaproteobacteria bacterium]